MIPQLLYAVALGAGIMDPVEYALERYRSVEAYQVTLKSFAGSSAEIIHYTYRRPGYVRMDFVTPHAGVILVYNPQKNEARLWPLGARFFSIALDPASRLIQSHAGQRVDRSDIGALLRNVQNLQRAGDTTTSADNLSGREMLRITVNGTAAASIGVIQRYILWLDAETWLPRRVISRDAADRPIEEVWFEGLRVDPELPAAIFSP